MLDIKASYIALSGLHAARTQFLFILELRCRHRATARSVVYYMCTPYPHLLSSVGVQSRQSMTLRRFEPFFEASRTAAKRGLCIALVECVLTLV